MVFVQTNLDDELYEQEDDENTSSEIVFEEFVECVRLLRSAPWRASRICGDAPRPALFGAVLTGVVVAGAYAAAPLSRGHRTWTTAPYGLTSMRSLQGKVCD
jgi:hypothetical protein